jgi:hypothetical protein
MEIVSSLRWLGLWCIPYPYSLRVLFPQSFETWSIQIILKMVPAFTVGIRENIWARNPENMDFMLQGDIHRT